MFRQSHESISGNGCLEVTKEASSRLRSFEDWTQMLELSKSEPVLIFKHSTSCNISSNLLAEVEGFLSQHRNVPFGTIHVVEDRNLSAVIADHTGIRHQSPQMIAIANEVPIWYTSHWSIDLNELERLLATTAE